MRQKRKIIFFVWCIGLNLAKANVIEHDLAGGRCVCEHVFHFSDIGVDIRETPWICWTKSDEKSLKFWLHLSSIATHIIVSAAVTHPTWKYDWFRCSVRCRFACVYATHSSHFAWTRRTTSAVRTVKMFGINLCGARRKFYFSFHSIWFLSFPYFLRSNARVPNSSYTCTYFRQVVRHENECT